MSMTFFSQVLAGIVPKPDGFIIPVGDDWRQGRTVYGGLSAALCVECAIRSILGLPPLRSAQFCFVGPATGELQIAPSLGGAGLLRVGNSVQMARQHPAEVKSLALLSRETFQEGLQYLRQASQLPGLFVVDDNDEYPPTVEAIYLAYINSPNPGKKFVHYSAATRTQNG